MFISPDISVLVPNRTAMASMFQKLVTNTSFVVLGGWEVAVALEWRGVYLAIILKTRAFVIFVALDKLFYFL